LKKLSLNAVYLPGVIVFGFASTVTVGKNRLQWKDFQLSLIGALVFLTDMFLIFTNQQWFELPLIASFILIATNNFTVHHNNGQNNPCFTSSRTYAILLLVGATIFLPIFVSQYVALAHAAMEKNNPPGIRSVTRFTQPCLRDLLLYEGETPESNGRQYTTYVNKGVSMLLAFSNRDETVLTIDMFNPFPYALGRMPPSGGIAAAAYNYTLSEKHRPSDDRFFGDAHIVMVPKKPAAGDIFYYGFLKIYEPALKKRYYLVTQSDWWYLYRRRK
jgi:hypothetical protein